MKKHSLLVSIALVSLLGACKKSDDPAPSGPSYSVPTSYNYTAVDYSYETTRLNMFKRLETELKKAIPTSTVTGQAVDSITLVNMFNNANAVFTDSVSWNGNGINLADENTASALVETYLGKYAAASHAANYTPTETAAEGVAGLKKNASNAYLLLGADGINYAQVIQKVQFGSLMIYQIMNRLDAVASLDNTTLVTGKTYTAQEHAWDEAYGYMGFPIAPVDSLTNSGYVSRNKAKFFYIGNYSTQTDNTTNLYATKTLATAFIKGRAAITHKDNATRNHQIDIIKTTLRKFLGATMLQEYTEMTSAKFADPAARNGLVSEMIGLVEAMKFVPGKIISDAQINDLLAHLHPTDVWQISQDDLDYVKDQVIAIYAVDFK